MSYILPTSRWEVLFDLWTSERAINIQIRVAERFKYRRIMTQPVRNVKYYLTFGEVNGVEGKGGGQEFFKYFYRTSPIEPPLGRNKHLTCSLRRYRRRSLAAWVVGSRISWALCWFCHHRVWNSRAHQRMDLNCRRWQLSWWADDNFHPFGMTYILK